MASAENGRVEFAVEGALIDACAVFAESEDVGGPETKMERLGVLKSEGCCAERMGAVGSCSGVEPEDWRVVL